MLDNVNEECAEFSEK